LFPGAAVVTIDIDPDLAASQPDNPNTTFVPGDACRLPFPDQSFELVTMFDVLEHIVDDRQAAAEALRVAKAGGTIAVSTPDAAWRYPYFGFMAPYCPHEQVLMDEWGHVRRGYRQSDLESLFASSPTATATFIGPVTAFYHDVAFSKLRRRQRLALYALAALPTAAAYLLHRPDWRGAELAASWRR
jgi:ubiquinone/menaquinone biosynthesis C-methylase UbiE